MRFHGLFAPNAKLLSRVVPAGEKAPRPCRAAGTSSSDTPTTDPSRENPSSRRREPSRIDFHSRLKRISKLDVLACGKCGGRIKVLAVIEEPAVIEKILRHLGLPHVPLPTSPARGQRAFDFFAA